MVAALLLAFLLSGCGGSPLHEATDTQGCDTLLRLLSLDGTTRNGQRVGTMRSVTPVTWPFASAAGVDGELVIEWMGGPTSEYVALNPDEAGLDGPLACEDRVEFPAALHVTYASWDEVQTSYGVVRVSGPIGALDVGAVGETGSLTIEAWLTAGRGRIEQSNGEVVIWGE